MSWKRLKRALADERGVSAIEFAFILPLFLVIYAGATELSSAFMSSRRVNHAASALADLTTQQSTLNTSEFQNIFAASSIILQPFPTTTLSLRLTSITQKSNGTYTVDWSQAVGSALPAYTKGQSFSGSQLPSGVLVNAGDNVVMSEAKYAFTSPISYALPTAMTFSDTAYARPRGGTTIPCTTC